MIQAAIGWVGRVFAERFDRSAIDSVDGLGRFIGTRAAYIAQTSLYGYLKTRMGTSFQRHFEDDEFSRVIRASAIRLFYSCLSDLTVFAVATARTTGTSLTNETAVALARSCFHDGLARGLDGNELALVPPEVFSDFEGRLAATDWDGAAHREAAFGGSVADLIRFAPVIDQYKALDQEVVTNSIRFRWRDVREGLRKRIDGDAIAHDWLRRSDALT